jgi:hypothetical protein
MAVRPEEIASIIRQQIEQFGGGITAVDVGTVVESGDGIARVYGLRNAMYGELLEFRTKERSGAEKSLMGLALNLEEDIVGAIVLGDYTDIKEGDEVRSTGRIIEVPVGDALIGRVVDPLGQPIDGRGPVNTDKARPIERIAPNVVVRESVNTSVHTGIKAIDAMIPIGRGQRELIIGDRFTGKTTICLDAIIAQKNTNVVCIYVGIGQQASKVAQVVGILEENGAMEHTIVVAANASDAAALQYLAPYAGCAMGEEFMEQGKDALVIYDDLSSTPGPTARCPSCSAAPRAVKPIPATSSTSTAACWSARPSFRRQTVVARLPPCRSLRRRQATCRPTFRPTSSPLPTARSTWRATFSPQAFARPSTRDSPSHVSVAPRRRRRCAVVYGMRLDLAQYCNLPPLPSSAPPT